jgi:hypothetical protein
MQYASDEKSEGYGSKVGGGTDEKSEQKTILSKKTNLPKDSSAVANAPVESVEGEKPDKNNSSADEPSDKSMCAEFFDEFKRITGKNLRVMDAKFKRQFNARIKEGFTVEEMVRATRSAFGTEYHQQFRHYLTPEFITRPDKLQKYLSAEQTAPKWKGVRENPYKGGKWVDKDNLTHEEHTKKYGGMV